MRLNLKIKILFFIQYKILKHHIYIHNLFKKINYWIKISIKRWLK